MHDNGLVHIHLMVVTDTLMFLNSMTATSQVTLHQVEQLQMIVVLMILQQLTAVLIPIVLLVHPVTLSK